MIFQKDAPYFVFAFTLLLPVTGASQQTKQAQQAPTDSSAQASPLGPTLHTPATDSSEQASPIGTATTTAKQQIRAHTALHVVLAEGIDSSTLKNGQTVRGKLISSVVPNAEGGRTMDKSSLKPGTPVEITVVATVPAGKLNAVGEISLELVKVGVQTVYTDTLTFRGQPGHKDLPDSAPMVGTNAGMPAGAALTFVVQAPPSFAEPTPTTRTSGPGSITGHVAGSKPSNFGQPAVSTAAGSGVGATSTGVGTATGAMGQPQNSGQVSSSPSAAGSNTSPAQPH